MPQGRTKKPTDWRQELKNMGQLPTESRGFGPEFRGHTILARGNRKSTGNEVGFSDEGPQDIDALLRMMDINLKDRIKNAKKPRPPGIDIRTRAQKIKGIFGGG